jgi:flagellar hook-length control protein FliK
MAPSLALDNLSIAPPPAAGSAFAPSPASGACQDGGGGFTGHLQRAAQSTQCQSDNSNSDANSQQTSRANNSDPSNDASSSNSSNKQQSDSNSTSRSAADKTDDGNSSTGATNRGGSKRGSDKRPGANSDGATADSQVAAPTTVAHPAVANSAAVDAVKSASETDGKSANDGKPGVNQAVSTQSTTPTAAGVDASAAATAATANSTPDAASASADGSPAVQQTVKPATSVDPAASLAAAAAAAQAHAQHGKQKAATSAAEKLNRPSAVSSAADPTKSATGSSSLVVDQANSAPQDSANRNEPAKPNSADGKSFDAAAAIAAATTQVTAAAATSTPAASNDGPHKDNATQATSPVDTAAAKQTAAAPNVATAPEPQPNSLNSANAATTGAQSGSAGATSDVDRVRFLQRVSNAFQAANDQGGQIRLRLSPPELGSMKLELTVRDGVMTAHVQTETDTARTMLLDHLPALREKLAEHNVTIERFDVDLGGRFGGNAPQNNANNANSGYPSPDNMRRPNSPTNTSSITTAVASTSIAAANGKLDITV